MARIRTIKPEIWLSPQVMNLDLAARLLFIGLITQADDEGRGTADPRRLKAAIFGGDDETSSNVRRMLDAISSQGLVQLYEASGHGLLYQLTSWKAHQSIDRPRRSAYPEPDSAIGIRPLDDPSTSAREGSDRTGRERKGGEGNGPAHAREPDGADGSAGAIPAEPGRSTDMAGSDEWQSVVGVDPEAMRAWIEHRAANKPPHGLRPHERLAAAKLLAGMGSADRQRAAVNMAVGNGWNHLRASDGGGAVGGKPARSTSAADRLTWVPEELRASNVAGSA